MMNWMNRKKPTTAPAETIPFTKILTNGQNAPKLSPMSLVVWETGKPPGGTPVSKPLRAKSSE